MAAGGKRGGGAFIVLAIVLIVLLGAGYLAIRLLPGVGGLVLGARSVPTAAPTPSSIKVVILTQPVARGGTITESVVTLADIPQTQYTQGLFYGNIADVVNKRARIDLLPGMPVTPSLIIDGKKSSLPSFDIPTGMVAISIPMNRLTAVAYALQPGDHVNILAAFLMADLDPAFQSRTPNKTGVVVAPGPQTTTSATTSGSSNQQSMITITMSVTGPGADQGRAELDSILNQAQYLLPSEIQRPRLVSQTLVQDVTVLWIGDFDTNFGSTTVPSAKPVVTPTPNPDGTTTAATVVRPDIITLVVSPQDASTINYLMLTGAKLNMTLRSAGDASRIQTEAVTLQFIMDQYRFPLPAKQPYGIEPRIDTLAYPPLKNGE